MKAVRIKQQKQIRAFLIEEFGADRARALSEKQENILYALIENAKEWSKSRKASLTHTILPCIALYRVLLEECTSKEEAYVRMRKYMLEKVAAGTHKSMVRMEAMPGFYAMYSRGFVSVVRKTDLWESTQRRSRDFFDVTIRKCLWHTACRENGCAELCRLFCEADDVTYGGLKKIGFSRTKTLGGGGDCCDFHFYRK